MDILRVKNYDRFACLGGRCPETCCRGWKVLVDEGTLSFMKGRPFPGRLLLTLPVSDKKNDPVLDITNHRCFFHTRDRLCYLQKTYGEERMPAVCRTYPRERTNCGYLAFESLDLACFEAARLFLKSGAPSWELVDGEVTYRNTGTNDDEEYLLSLVAEYAKRAEEAAVIYEPEDLYDFLRDMCAHALEAQSKAIAGADPFSDEEIPKDTVTEGLTDIKNILPLPMNAINLIVNTCLYHDGVRLRSPYLYRMCRLYFKTFDKLNEAEGEVVLKKLFQDELDKREEGCVKYAGYFTMHMLRACPDLYEDYSFFRKTFSAVMHTNMIILFDALTRASKGGILSTEDEARIIAVYEKRAFHSPGLLNRMYGVINNYET